MFVGFRLDTLLQETPLDWESESDSEEEEMEVGETVYVNVGLSGVSLSH